MLEGVRRHVSMSISHLVHGEATLTDNAPLSEAALHQCLDDDLKPADWMKMLNQRVFFWVDEKNLRNHLRANTCHGESRIVLVFDTLGVVKKYFMQVELTAINTGSTLRRPARRGLSTFSPAHLHSYSDWQLLRGGRDRIKELTITGGVLDVDAHLLECRDESPL
jgi:hypothetical protein